MLTSSEEGRNKRLGLGLGLGLNYLYIIHTRWLCEQHQKDNRL